MMEIILALAAVSASYVLGRIAGVQAERKVLTNLRNEVIDQMNRELKGGADKMPTQIIYGGPGAKRTFRIRPEE